MTIRAGWDGRFLIRDSQFLIGVRLFRPLFRLGGQGITANADWLGIGDGFELGLI
jgi:hypothetical protein